MQSRLIQSPSALRRVCARWMKAEAIGIDTEFVRERTFYPRPALIQVADAEGVVLIDIPALKDLTALGPLLATPMPVKVMHAFSEDLEVMAVAAGAEPEHVFDTQLAGAFAGYGFSLGYRGLVETMLEVTLDKGETRSDWLRRPLSAAQLRYAALDAAYLLPLYRQLDTQLNALGRRSWLEEEIGHVRRARERDKQRRLAYLKVKDRQRLSPEDHALLRALAEWREREAMARDRPRRHVLTDAALVAIAQARPQNIEALRALEGISGHVARRYTEAIFKRVAAAAEITVTEADMPVDLRPHAGTMRRLKRIVKTEANRLKLPPELIANRRALESLLMAVLKNDGNQLPPEFLGWRSDIVTATLLDCIQASKS